MPGWLPCGRSGMQTGSADCFPGSSRPCGGDENLMPLLIECVENDLTLGEICGVLRQVWGEYQAAG